MIKSLPKYLLLLAFMITAHEPAHAQLHGKFRSITVDDGLAQNSVWDILQDSAGYYWFATADGINRYDGENYKHYKRVAGNAITISGNTVGKLLLDSKDRIWALHNYGISVYNHISDQFDHHFKDAYALGEYDGGFWILTGDSLVQKLDIETLNQLSSFEINRPKERTHHVTSRHIQIGDSFYLQGKAGVERINVSTKEFQVFKTPIDFGGALVALNDSIIFCPNVGTYSYLLNTKTGAFEPQPFGADFPHKAYITDIQYYKNTILMGSIVGVFVLDRETLELVQHIESFEAGPGYRFVESIYLDKFGTLFFGTNGNGLKVFSPYENRFPTYTTHQARLDMVKAITVLENGQLVTGVYEQGLIIYTDQEHFRQINFFPATYMNGVPGVHAIDQDRLFLINMGCLVVFNTKTDREEYRLPVDTNTFSYPVFFEQPDGIMLNNEHKIFKVSKDYKEDYQVFYKQSKTNGYITCFAVLDSGLAVGNHQKLILYDYKNQTSKEILNVYMKAILIAQNKIFAASQSGLFEFTLDGELLYKHDVTSGLTNDFIYGVLEDDLGYIWISHNKGLSRIKPGTNEYLQFDVTDGLQSNEFNTGAYYKHTDGKLYFGGVSGVNVIDPNLLILNKRPPQLLINNISLFDEPLRMDTAANEKKLLIFNYEQNTLSFDFAVSDFTQPGSTRYAYQMIGLDENWIESGDKHYARYANLPAGHYTFQVKAANGDGVWMQQPKTIRIVIIPPYWQTTWFLILMIAAGLLVIVGVVLIILARQKAKLRRELEVQHQLEMERVRISRDLHDNVGAQLSYLITNMEWIADHPDSLDQEMRREQLKQLSDTGRQAITTLRQTIWAISQNEICVEEFADRFKQFAMKMVEYKPALRLHFHENITEKVVLAPAIALNLFRICQEAFNNAIKHSGATEFDISFNSDQINGFAFELRDNGVGFDTEQSGPAGHYGLANMKARAKESDAVLLIQSQPQQGTEVKLLWNDQSNNAYAV